jgi:hypothetical protein
MGKELIKGSFPKTFWLRNIMMNIFGGIDGDSQVKEGSIMIWLIVSDPPKVPFVLSGWQLIVDGESILGENKLGTSSIDIKGKTAEFKYGDLSFVFQFPI